MPHIRPHSTKIQVKMNLQYQGKKNSDSRLSCKLIIAAHSDVSGRHLSNMVYCFVTVIAKNKLCNYGTNVTVTQQAIEIHYIFFPMEATAAEARLSSDTTAAKYNSNNTSTEWNAVAHGKCTHTEEM